MFMNPVTCRRLLQLDNAPLSSSAASPHGSSTAVSAAAFRKQLDSSIALTIVVLLTAFFFVGLLSFYIRRSSPPSSGPSEEESAAAVNSLPVVAYSDSDSKSKQQGQGMGMVMEECPICLSEFEEGESVKLIPYCGHVFHIECLDTWLALHVTCPLCRSDQLFKRAETETETEDHHNILD